MTVKSTRSLQQDVEIGDSRLMGYTSTSSMTVNALVLASRTWRVVHSRLTKFYYVSDSKKHSSSSIGCQTSFFSFEEISSWSISLFEGKARRSHCRLQQENGVPSSPTRFFIFSILNKPSFSSKRSLWGCQSLRFVFKDWRHGF